MARRLLPLLRPGMLILLDRAFDANAFLGDVAAAGAMLLARAKSTRHPAVLGRLPDGSYLSHLDGLKVRIIEASVTMAGPTAACQGQLPADHRANRLPPVPGPRRGPALS